MQAFPALQVIVIALITGLSSIFYIAIILALVFYIFAVVAMIAFRENDMWHFGGTYTLTCVRACVLGCCCSRGVRPLPVHNVLLKRRATGRGVLHCVLYPQYAFRLASSLWHGKVGGGF